MLQQKLSFSFQGLRNRCPPKHPLILSNPQALGSELLLENINTHTNTNCIPSLFWAHRMTGKVKHVVMQQRNCAIKFSKELTFMCTKQEKPVSECTVYRPEHNGDSGGTESFSTFYDWKWGGKSCWNYFLSLVQRHIYTHHGTPWIKLSNSFGFQDFILPLVCFLTHTHTPSHLQLGLSPL